MADKATDEKLKMSEEMVEEQAAKIKEQELELEKLRKAIAKSKGEDKKPTLPSAFEHEGKMYEFKQLEFNYVAPNGKVKRMKAEDAVKDKAVIAQLLKVKFTGLVEVSK